MNISSINTPELCPSVFGDIADIAYKNWGLVLVPEKRKMVASRLRHRLSACGFHDFRDYFEYIKSANGVTELRNVISALSTNVSHFFREPHHFEIMSKFLNEHERSTPQRRLRVWSAGCSNGQEPYSIAIHTRASHKNIAEGDFKILATDVDPSVIAFAKSGSYEERMLSGFPEKYFSTYMKKDSEDPDQYHVSGEIRSLVYFKELNLLSSWPMRGPFDIIFCRNVVIYFNQETQNKLWARFNQLLNPGGLLFLGHSERISLPEKFGFDTVGPTAFVKSKNASP